MIDHFQKQTNQKLCEVKSETLVLLQINIYDRSSAGFYTFYCQRKHGELDVLGKKRKKRRDNQFLSANLYELGSKDHTALRGRVCMKQL